MAVSLSIRQLVILVIAVVCIISGVFLLVRIIMIKDVIPEYPVSENLIVKVNPYDSQRGTLFLISAVSNKIREQQDLKLIVEKNTSIDFVNLYDDGDHYDKKSNDGFYAGFFDSTNKDLGGYNIRSKDNGILASFKISESKCEFIFGDNSKEINFVILPYNYSNYNDFKKDAEDIILEENSLLNIEPFKSNQNKFSFSVINSLRNLDCKIGCYNISTVVCCDDKAVLEEASKCHYDSIFILVNNEELCGSASSYAKVCSKNPDANLVLLHELGHSFADLADEYVYSDFYNYDIGEIDNVNCDKQGCEKWKNITEGCYEGCSYPELYRAEKENSIMYQLIPVFNSVSKKHIEGLIENYISGEKQIEKSLPLKKSYFVNLRYDKGDIKIENLFLKPVMSGEGYKKSDYVAEIKDKENNSIFKTAIYVPNRIFPIPNQGKIIVQDKIDFALMLPYSKNADNLMIYKNNEIIAQTSLAVLSETCGNNICEKSENHLSCAKDCGIKDGFCETSSCDSDCESQKNCGIKKRILYILPGFLIIFALSIIYWVMRRRGFEPL